MRICIGLETHDYMEAQRRALLLLRYNKRLGIYDREIPEESEITYPEKTDDLPLFRDDNEIQSENGNSVDIFRRKKIDARPMSTRERAMLPAAERVNSIFTANVEKAQFLQRLADMLDDFLAGKRQEIILPDGTSTTVGVMQGKADFIAKARAFMDAEGMAANAGDNRITNIGARSRLSLIFDTYTRSCYGQARWERHDPGNALLLPGMAIRPAPGSQDAPPDTCPA